MEGAGRVHQTNDDSRFTTLDSRIYELLTPRELEVLGLIAEGLPNKRVAQRLGISEHTVKYHINTILGKLGAESRTEAVTRAARLGWLIL
jgi:DNA-binding NarL/FixJ family response regulator